MAPSCSPPAAPDSADPAFSRTSEKSKTIRGFPGPSHFWPPPLTQSNAKLDGIKTVSVTRPATSDDSSSRVPAQQLRRDTAPFAGRGSQRARSTSSTVTGAPAPDRTFTSGPRRADLDGGRRACPRIPSAEPVFASSYLDHALGCVRLNGRCRPVHLDISALGREHEWPARLAHDNLLPPAVWQSRLLRGRSRRKSNPRPFRSCRLLRRSCRAGFRPRRFSSALMHAP